MSTVFLSEKQCCLCGERNETFSAPHGYGISNLRDLDTRPTSSQRSSIYMYGQRCSGCGYCAFDISDGPREIREIIDSVEYRRQLTDSSYSDAANLFLCMMIIAETLSQWKEAGWAALHGAWICDDSAVKDKAVSCRLKALAFFTICKEQNRPFSLTGDRTDELLVMADLLRRTRQFDAAKQLCEKEMQAGHDRRVFELLDFQIELIENNDDRCHEMAEILEEFDY